MGKDPQQFNVYGRPPRTLLPVISASSTYIEDFKQYLEEVPYNYLSLTNNSNSYLDVYYQGNYIRILANETKIVKDTYFSNLKIITNTESISSGDLIIVVEKSGIDADSKARQDYIEQNKPLNKVLSALRWVR